MTIQDICRKKMKEKGLRQSEFAKLLGVVSITIRTKLLQCDTRVNCVIDYLSALNCSLVIQEITSDTRPKGQDVIEVRKCRE